MNPCYRDPKAPWNPGTPVDITPYAFERTVLDWLKKSAEQSGVEANAKHLGVVTGSGGNYEIDVLLTCTIFSGAEVMVLVECKHQRRPVEREDALTLESKLRDVGAHKGMLFSTSGFQQGALKYASARGIAAITVIAGHWLYETKAAFSGPVDPPRWARHEEFAGIRVAATEGGTSCRTINLRYLDALTEWMATLGQAADQVLSNRGSDPPEALLPPAGLYIFGHPAPKLFRDAGERVEDVSRFLDHISLAVTTSNLSRLEGQEDLRWGRVAEAIGIRAALDLTPLTLKKLNPSQRCGVRAGRGWS